MKKSLLSLALLCFMCSSVLGWDTRFEWDANPAGENVSEYKVYKSVVSGGGYGLVATIPAGPSPSFIDSNGDSVTTIFYVVTAISGESESSFSNEISKDKPPPEPEPTPDPVPGVPINLKITGTITLTPVP